MFFFCGGSNVHYTVFIIWFHLSQDEERKCGQLSFISTETLFKKRNAVSNRAFRWQQMPRFLPIRVLSYGFAHWLILKATQPVQTLVRFSGICGDHLRREKETKSTLKSLFSQLLKSNFDTSLKPCLIFKTSGHFFSFQWPKFQCIPATKHKKIHIIQYQNFIT